MGDDIWISLKKTILAIPVPKIASMAINIIDLCVSGSEAISKKPEKQSTTTAGISIIVKFPVLIVKGVRSERYFFIRLTFVA